MLKVELDTVRFKDHLRSQVHFWTPPLSPRGPVLRFAKHLGRGAGEIRTFKCLSPLSSPLKFLPEILQIVKDLPGLSQNASTQNDIRLDLSKFLSVAIKSAVAFEWLALVRKVWNILIRLIKISQAWWGGPKILFESRKVWVRYAC